MPAPGRFPVRNQSWLVDIIDRMRGGRTEERTVGWQSGLC